MRAGYGVFYDRPNTIATNSPANQAPFGTVVSFPGYAVNSVANPYAGRINPFPADPFDVPQDAAFLLPHTAFSYDERLRNGRLQSWNATVERELFSTYLLRVGYAGSHGDRLAMGRELNAAVYAAGATTATTNQRRPLFPDFGSIVSIESTGRSDYNALQLTLEKRMARICRSKKILIWPLAASIQISLSFGVAGSPVRRGMMTGSCGWVVVTCCDGDGMLLAKSRKNVIDHGSTST